MHLKFGMRNRSLHRVIRTVLVLAALVHSTMARADEPRATTKPSASSSKNANSAASSEPGIRGFWISADVPLVNASLSIPPANRSQVIAYGLGLSPNMTVRIGGQLNEHLLIGVRGSMVYNKVQRSYFTPQSSLSLPSQSDFRESFAGRLELLSGKSTVRKFVALEAEVMTDVLSMPTTPQFERANYGIGLGGSIGAHIFPAPSVSIDPYFSVSYERDLHYGVTNIRATGGIMFSGWFWR